MFAEELREKEEKRSRYLKVRKYITLLSKEKRLLR